MSKPGEQIFSVKELDSNWRTSNVHFELDFIEVDLEIIQGAEWHCIMLQN